MQGRISQQPAMLERRGSIASARPTVREESEIVLMFGFCPREI